MHSRGPVRTRGQRVEIERRFNVRLAALQVSPLHSAEATLHITWKVIRKEFQAFLEESLCFVPSPLEKSRDGSECYVCFGAVPIETKGLQRHATSHAGPSGGAANLKKNKPVISLSQGHISRSVFRSKRNGL